MKKKPLAPAEGPSALITATCRSTSCSSASQAEGAGSNAVEKDGRFSAAAATRAASGERQVCNNTTDLSKKDEDLKTWSDLNMFKGPTPSSDAETGVFTAVIERRLDETSFRDVWTERRQECAIKASSFSMCSTGQGALRQESYGFFSVEQNPPKIELDRRAGDETHLTWFKVKRRPCESVSPTETHTLWRRNSK